MTVDQIREFCVIAKLESFTRAAEYLYISQSALSRHMSELEKNLNVRLIERGNRVFGLTRAGKTFYDEATKIIDDLERLIRKTQRTESGKTGKLTLGVFAEFMPFIIDRVKEFKDRHSEIDVQAQTFLGEDIVKSIVAGETDIGLIFSFDAPEKVELANFPVGRDELCVVVAGSHPFADRSSVSVEQLENERVYILKNNRIAGSNKIITEIESGFSRIKTRVMCEKVEDIALHTRLGDGISIMSRVFAEERMRDCRILNISGKEISYDVSLCWNRENTNPALTEFINSIG